MRPVIDVVLLKNAILKNVDCLQCGTLWNLIDALATDDLWIPCSDQDPADNGDYLCTVKSADYNGNEYYRYIDYLTYRDGRWYTEDGDIVIAWWPQIPVYDGEEE